MSKCIHLPCSSFLFVFFLYFLCVSSFPKSFVRSTSTLRSSVTTTVSMSTAVSAATKKYDLVLWGASGFTGSLCAKYLSKTYAGKLKIAIAGRSEEKLKSLGLGNVDIITADISDQATLEAMTSQTSVVISTAGPFAKIGMPIVDACVKTNTNYVDITGEPQYVRRVIDAYHDTAISKGIKIVPCCGFDCIPSDLGCQMMVEEMKSRNLEPKEVRLMVDKIKGGASGGTIASVINLIESSSISQLAAFANPFCLAPRDPQSGLPQQATDPSVVVAGSDSSVHGYDEVMQTYTMPYIMQGIDTRVINRSNALSGWQYGRNFIYSERMMATSMMAAMMSALVMSLGGLLLVFPPTRWLAKNFIVPKPGQGPSPEMQKTGFYKMKFYGTGINKDGKEEVVKGGLNAMEGDPGYAQTARYIAEAGIACLPKDKGGISGSGFIGGVLTPSTAFGTTFREYLKNKQDIKLDFYIDA